MIRFLEGVLWTAEVIAGLASVALVIAIAVADERERAR